MRAVTGSGLGAGGGGAPKAAPFALVHVIHTGQSLAMGYGGAGGHLTTQPYSNKQLHDSTNTYDRTNPSAPTLSLIPLVDPERAGVASSVGTYPVNFDGNASPADAAMANTITWAALAAGYPSFNVATTNVGVGGAPMGGIQKGGFDHSYEASLYEASAMALLAPGAGFSTFGGRCVVLTHGEADAGNITTATYQASLMTLLANYQTDWAAITAQTAPIYMILSQQNSSPLNYGPDTTGMAQWLASLANPSILLTGPKYQYPSADGIHLTDYRAYGEKLGQVFMVQEAFLRGEGPAWAPLSPTSITRSGTTVTVNLHVPHGPLVFDGTVTPPHQSGPFSMWATGKGFEAYDNRHRILTLSGSGVSPISVVLTDDGTNPVAHGLTTGDQYVLVGELNYAASWGLFTVTVVNSTTFTLNGTTGAAFSAGIWGIGFAPIGITSATIVGDSVQLTLARAPTSQLWIGAADNADALLSSTGLSTFGAGHCTVVRDSDPWKPTYTGASGADNFNWLISFRQAVP